MHIIKLILGIIFLSYSKFGVAALGTNNFGLLNNISQNVIEENKQEEQVAPEKQEQEQKQEPEKAEPEPVLEQKDEVEVEALKFFKIPVSLTRQEQAQLTYNKAINLLDKKDMHESMAILTKLLEQNTDFPAARLKLVDIHCQKGELKEAEALLKKGLKIDKNNSNYIQRQAEVYVENKEYPAALELLLKMPIEKQREVEYQELLAFVYYQQGLYSTAIKIYLGLLASSQAQSNWWLGLAICYDAIGEHKNAFINFKLAKHDGRFDVDVTKYIEQRILAIKAFDPKVEAKQKMARN